MLHRALSSRITSSSSFSACDTSATARYILTAKQINRKTALCTPPSRGIHTAMHSCLSLTLAPHFKKLSQLRECADARQALASGKFRDAMRDCERIRDIAAGCRDEGMLCSATYFRSSILSLSGMWHLESEELERLHSLASSPAFPPHFQTAVALLLSCAQLKSGVEATAMPSEENAAAAGMQSTLALLAATASLCKGGTDTKVFSAAAAAADRDNEAAASCYAGLLHVTALLNKGCLPEAEIQCDATIELAHRLKQQGVSSAEAAEIAGVACLGHSLKGKVLMMMKAPLTDDHDSRVKSCFTRSLDLAETSFGAKHPMAMRALVLVAQSQLRSDGLVSEALLRTAMSNSKSALTPPLDGLGYSGTHDVVSAAVALHEASSAYHALLKGMQWNGRSREAEGSLTLASHSLACEQACPGMSRDQSLHAWLMRRERAPLWFVRAMGYRPWLG